MLLSNDNFLLKLNDFMQSSYQEKGETDQKAPSKPITISFKRMSWKSKKELLKGNEKPHLKGRDGNEGDQDDLMMAVDPQEPEFDCLVRAVLGKKKISTRVDGKNFLGFNQDYISICKTHMSALKRKEKKKK